MKKERIVKTKIAKWLLELFGWECFCRYLEYKTWKVEGYCMTKEQRI